MKKISVLFISVLLSTSALASTEQSHGSEHKDPSNKIEKMAKKLELSEEQKDAFGEILRESHKERQALREKTQQKLNKILTGEQLEKMEEMHKRRGKKHSR